MYTSHACGGEVDHCPVYATAASTVGVLVQGTEVPSGDCSAYKPTIPSLCPDWHVVRVTRVAGGRCPGFVSHICFEDVPLGHEERMDHSVVRADVDHFVPVVTLLVAISIKLVPVGVVCRDRRRLKGSPQQPALNRLCLPASNCHGL